MGDHGFNWGSTRSTAIGSIRRCCGGRCGLSSNLRLLRDQRYPTLGKCHCTIQTVGGQSGLAEDGRLGLPEGLQAEPGASKSPKS